MNGFEAFSVVKTLVCRYPQSPKWVCVGLLPCSGPLRASLVWWWGKISILTCSEALASSWVASASVQYSILVPSTDKMWSPACSAPHLQRQLDHFLFCQPLTSTELHWSQASFQIIVKNKFFSILQISWLLVVQHQSSFSSLNTKFDADFQHYN